MAAHKGPKVITSARKTLRLLREGLALAKRAINAAELSCSTLALELSATDARETQDKPSVKARQPKKAKRSR